MKTVLINYFNDVLYADDDNYTLKGFAEVSENGITYFDNYSDNKESLKRLADAFLGKYLSYAPESQREAIKNSITRAYEMEPEDLEFLKNSIVHVFEYFSRLTRDVKFVIADRPMPKICTLRQENGKNKDFTIRYLGSKRENRVLAVDDEFENEYQDCCDTIKMYYTTYVPDFDELGIDVSNIVNTKKINKKALLALATAGCVLVGGLGGFGITKITKGRNNIEDGSLSPTETPIEVSIETVTPTPTVETVVETPVVDLPTPAPTNIPFTPEIDHAFVNTSSDSNVVSYTIIKGTDADYDEPHLINEDKFNDYSTMLLLSYDTFTDMTNYLYNRDNWGELRTLGVTIDFAKYFNYLPEADRGFIKYFSDLRNDIVYCFYRFEDYNSAINFNNQAVMEALRCIRDNGYIKVNQNGVETYIRFSDLSYEAQNVVLDIAFNFQTFMATNNVTYNNETYTNDDILTEVFGEVPDHPTLG